MKVWIRLVAVLVGMSVFSDGVFADILEHVGSYSNWPSAWTPLSSLNDADDGKAEHLDFVGDANNPCGYWANRADYVFFRQRVDADAVTSGTFKDTTLIIIDVVGYKFDTASKTLVIGDDMQPDYGFAWDSKSSPNPHGLEMMIRATNGTVWNGTQMDDLDGNVAKKLDNDINGGGRTTDGYLRTIDSQPTTNFGNTTFIDYAISWSYLNTYTALSSNQTWRVAFGSISNATDHNNISEDMAGGINPADSISLGWATLPEPGTAGYIFLAASGVWLYRRIRHMLLVVR